MKNINKFIISLLFAAMLFTAGCGSENPVSGTKENLSLKIGVMPAVDSAPIFLADKEGYFTEL
jgi:NitT/TauT family transport system substrate-binding protein